MLPRIDISIRGNDIIYRPGRGSGICVILHLDTKYTDDSEQNLEQLLWRMN